MRWRDRLRVNAPVLVRSDARSLIGIPLSASLIMMLERSGVHSLGAGVSMTLLTLVGARLAFWSFDLFSPERLYSIEVKRRLKRFRRDRERLRVRKRGCYLQSNRMSGFAAFLPTSLLRSGSPLSGEDQRLLERIDRTLLEIEQQFGVIDPFVQRQTARILGPLAERAGVGMDVGRKLATLTDFLRREDGVRLEFEERLLRERAEESPSGPLGTLQSQTHRFKAQQIANLRNAQQNVELYRAQLSALEAGLGNVRGRLAALASIDSVEIGIELEALDAELFALDEGVRLAAQAVSGDYFHAGGHYSRSASASSSAAATPRSPTVSASDR